MDSDHGIFEAESRKLEFTAPNFFKFTYHYYYEYENCSYEMVDQISNDTSFSGTYVIEGNRVVGTVTAGEQKASVNVIFIQG